MENYDIEEVLDFFETKILYSVERVGHIERRTNALRMLSNLKDPLYSSLEKSEVKIV